MFFDEKREYLWMNNAIYFVKYILKTILHVLFITTVADPERCLPCSGKAKVYPSTCILQFMGTNS